jgi:hypothetical protein
MKGLLHRLAERAAGSGVQVRSDARLPYGWEGLEWRADPEPGPSVLPHEEASDHDESFGAAPDTGTARERPGRERVRNVHARRESERSVEPFEAGKEMDAPAEPERTMQRDATPFARRFAQGNELRGARGSAQAFERARIDVPPPMLPPQALRATPRGARVTPLAPSDTPSPAASTREPRPAAPRPTPGARVPREAADASSMPGAARLAPRAPVSATPSEEATEVHIHIGRIEVSAVQEAPRVRTKPAKSRAQSLDAYLAERSRR